jgi:(1->4)-alpha-D-glucan 1-alpha-D-glucosylmutase
VRGFVTSVLADAAFVSDLEASVARLQRPGWINSLAQKLVTLTAPGVADLYQGSELWDLSLVDPDNRRPVDFSLRRRLLAEARAADAAAVWAAEDGTGLAKLLVVTTALHLRAAHPDWFGLDGAGGYGRLDGVGEAARHAVAFVRGGSAITIVPRLPLGLERRGGWGGTTMALPPGSWWNHLGDADAAWRGTVRMGDLLAGFPVALLGKESPADMRRPRP